MSPSTSVPPRPSKSGKPAAKRPATPTPAFKPRKHEARRQIPAAWLIGGVVALLVVVAGVVAIVSSTGSSDEDTAAWSQTRPVTVSGTALPVLGNGEDTALGLVAPSLSGATFDGDPVSYTPGTPTLLVFLAHWCPHCQVEVPLLVAWGHSGAVPAGLDVIGVATNTTSTRDNYPPSDWLAREGWQWPVLADSEGYEAAMAMGVQSFPMLVLVDAEGVVRWRQSGEIPIAVVQEQVAAVLNA